MTRPATPSRRLLAFATLLTAAVGLLAGVAADLSRAGLLGPPLRNLRVESSGPAALATARLVGALSWVGLGLFVLGPVAVAAALVVRGDDRPWAAVAWGAAALGLPALALLVAVALSTPSPYPDAVALVAAAAVVYLVYRLAAADRERAPWVPSRPLALALALGVAFVVTAAVGASVLAGPTAGLAVEEHPGPPAVAWDFEYESVGDGRGVVTVTHDGGRVVPVDDVGVRSTGFADVAGADQTARGEWQGETSDGTADGGRTIAPGDSVTVGVAGDCVVRVVHDDPPFVATMGKYRCPDAGTGDDARAGVPRPGGGDR